MAVDFDDIRRALVDTIADNATDLLKGERTLEDLITESLGETLEEVFSTIVDTADDAETQADDNEYGVDETADAFAIAADQQRRDDYIEGFNQAIALIRDALADINNL
jgi:hypothetical protein